METIWDRRYLDLDLPELNVKLTNYTRIILDLGTGDGSNVHHLADNFPDSFFIGVDSCRENLCEHSRAKLPNMLFVIASAQDLPNELNGLISHITINFPWGSLLESLLGGDSKLMRGLTSVSQVNATIDIRLNGGALAEAGWSLAAGSQQIYKNLLQNGWRVKNPMMMDSCALPKFPSTWAKRLAFGRDPRAIQLSGYI